MDDFWHNFAAIWSLSVLSYALHYKRKEILRSKLYYSKKMRLFNNANEMKISCPFNCTICNMSRLLLFLAELEIMYLDYIYCILWEFLISKLQKNISSVLLRSYLIKDNPIIKSSTVLSFSVKILLSSESIYFSILEKLCVER